MKLGAETVNAAMKKKKRERNKEKKTCIKNDSIKLKKTEKRKERKWISERK